MFAGAVFMGAVSTPLPTPATVTGAENGVSLDGTDVVLGNDVGDAAQPAALLSNREIVSPGGAFYLQIVDAAALPVYTFNILPSTLALSDTSLNAASLWEATRFILEEIAGPGPADTFSIVLDVDGSASITIRDVVNNEPYFQLLPRAFPDIRGMRMINLDGVVSFQDGTNAHDDIFVFDVSTGNINLNPVRGGTKVGDAGSPTAKFHIADSDGTAGETPFKLTDGVLVGTPEAGAFEMQSGQYLTKESGLRFAVGGVIADFFADAANVGETETDLYSYTSPANTLAVTGEKIEATYGGFFTSATISQRLRLYFGGTLIADTAALVTPFIAIQSSGWSVRALIIRTGADTARSIVTISYPILAGSTGTSIKDFETDLSGLTFSNTNILVLTGTAGVGAAGGEIVAKLGAISWWGAAG